MKIFKKRFMWCITYSIALFIFTVYTLLDTFVIPRSYLIVDDDDSSLNTTSQESNANQYESGNLTDNSYSDKNIKINIKTYRENNTTIYVADITLSSAEYLKTAFASNTFGRNITQRTSEIAESNNAILAINGDFYGAQSSGYVLRNGKVFRENSSDNSKEDLVIYADGSFEIINEGDTSLNELEGKNVLQVLSFGPALIDKGEIAVTQNDEVAKAMAKNPRTAIGIIDNLHYVFVVADGRTSESTGLSLYELATFLESIDVKIAYNLDGGGSSTMCFNGNVVNNPTTNGRNISERGVSDIVYIGN